MRAAIDFLVGGIQDDVGELSGRRGKEARSVLYEVTGDDFYAEF
jgi:hypothetical protein